MIYEFSLDSINLLVISSVFDFFYVSPSADSFYFTRYIFVFIFDNVLIILSYAYFYYTDIYSFGYY